MLYPVRPSVRPSVRPWFWFTRNRKVIETSNLVERKVCDRQIGQKMPHFRWRKCIWRYVSIGPRIIWSWFDTDLFTLMERALERVTGEQTGGLKVNVAANENVNFLCISFWDVNRFVSNQDQMILGPFDTIVEYTPFVHSLIERGKKSLCFWEVIPYASEWRCNSNLRSKVKNQYHWERKNAEIVFRAYLHQK